MQADHKHAESYAGYGIQSQMKHMSYQNTARQSKVQIILRSGYFSCQNVPVCAKI
jgi:hypothetical protein